MASLRTALVSVGCAIRNLPLAVSSLRRALLLDPTALQRRANPTAHANSAPTERPDASSKTSVEASARELWRRGDWDQAIEVLADARGGTARRLLQRLSSERGLLQSPHFAKALPQSATPTSPPFQPRPGCVVHLVTNSLPHTNAGYTTRTQQILLAQKALGLDPHAITRLGHPVAQGILTARRMDVVDGIRYHRLLPLWGTPGDAQRAMELAIDQAAALTRTLRPAVLHAATNHANGQVALALRDRFGIPVVYEVRGFLEESWASRAEDPLA
ncbi:MAG TPA: glycosyltransferase WbuB, partial [Actinobacteria bacterium]|nr:glycosyltransferase WbuB [Actinomycetota bacterium]